MEKEKLLDYKAKYIKIYNLLEILNYLFGKNNDMDLFEMNEWLVKIIDFYKSYGIVLNVNDFRVDDIEIDKIVKKYMGIFFKNINDLDNDIFNRVVFSMNELEISSEINNPILKDIYMAVKGINIRNIKILNRLFNAVNNEFVKLGINKVNFDNINLIKEEVKKKIIDCDILIKQIDKDKEKCKTRNRE